MTRQYLLRLIDKYLDGNASEEESEQLRRYYDSFQQDARWDEAVLGSSGEMEQKLWQRLAAIMQAGSKPTAEK